MKLKNFVENLRLLKLDAHTENEFIKFYSVDASSYQLKPKLVVFPKNIKELKILVKFAKKENLSLTARGSGTGLIGNSLNSGIIVDMKNFKKISIKGDSVMVESGVSKGDLDQFLETHQKFLSPNPSIGPFCKLGGMVGTNAGGSKGLKYGNVIENLQEIKVIDGEGNLISLPQNKKYSEKILSLAKKIEIEKFPKVSKNSSGYRLDEIKSIKDSQKIFAGSEGTLGIIISAKLKINKIPSKRKLIIIEYKSVNDCAIDCEKIVKLNPSSLEFVDKKTLSNIDYPFSKKCSCLLFVEFDSDLEKSLIYLRKIISGKMIKSLTKEKEIMKWWKFRDLALWFSLRSIKRQKRLPHVIEDAVVPVKLLPKLFFIMERLAQLYNVGYISYGHAGNGNIHIRLISKRKNLRVLQEISKKYFYQIIKMGGSITGEHGDGLARSEFVEKQYGKINYKIFKELKNLFDPENIFNPGKIISQGSTIIKNFEKFNPKSS